MEPVPSAPLESSLGKVDPPDASRLTALLEEHDIAYEVEVTAKPKWGNQHQGAWIELFVAEDRVQDGHRLAGTLFPAESPAGCSGS